MFEGAVAALLNRFLGRYVEDLDTENLNIGIFSGETYLTDLKLKPEALYQLGLPIKIQVGLIGKVSLKIPWTGLSSQPVILCIEDIYMIAVPAWSGRYDPEVEKRLIRAAKKKILEDLEGDGFLGPDVPSSIFDNLVTSIINNFQVTINNVHIRYEDRQTRLSPIACGLCIQSLSMATTNNKWKPGITTSSTSVYQLVRAESLSIYLDPKALTSLPEYPDKWELSKLLAWKSLMHRALQTFSMNNQEFQFLMKPFTARIKIIVNKSNDARAPRMLVDFVLQDVATQFTEQQYLTLQQLSDSLRRISINRPHRKYRPDIALHKNCVTWWRYAYTAILEHHVKPYRWNYFLAHRQNYHRYKEAFKLTLLKPNDTELKLDLQKYEDNLTIVNIIVAREHAKIELKKEDPQRITVEVCQSSPCGLIDKPNSVKLVVNSEKLHGIFNQLNSPERKEFFRMIGQSAEGIVKSDKPTQHTDHKYNFTMANCSLSLLRKEKEVLVVTLTQFLASIETRPSLAAFKISARIESFVIEGSSWDNELIPLITADNVLTGNMASNFLSIDFEKTPLNSDANFDISVTLEPIEIMYHEHAISEILRFFGVTEAHFPKLIANLIDKIHRVKDISLRFFRPITSRHRRFNLKMDLTAPYIILPEQGSFQKGGNLILLDFGRVTLRSELQAANVQLEDATLMELEELLYDRLHISCTDGLILFCHSGDDWREARNHPDSENHLIPKIQCNITLSHSIRTDYRLLPRTKLNISISSLKLNLSENKLKLMSGFSNFLPKLDNTITDKHTTGREVDVDKKLDDANCVKELNRVRAVIALSSIVAQQLNCEKLSNDCLDMNTLDVDRSVISSEISEEDLEQWARTVDLPGFDDNISPHNCIDLLLRFVVGELCVHLGHTVNGVEKPYLTLRVATLCAEAAIMEYGPAIQFSIGGILLADKTNAGLTGSYLELISTNPDYEVLTILYRKVRATCPDFKSHFKSTEQSLVMDLAHINIIFHRQSFLRMRDYFSDLLDIQCNDKIFENEGYCDLAFWLKTTEDPPVPPDPEFWSGNFGIRQFNVQGATKLSYSMRLNSLRVRLCDAEMDLLELTICGLENDCIYKANERMILRMHLRSIMIDDLSDLTLYPKILTADEEKVLDIKYVRHTPKLYKCKDIDAYQDDVMSDGSLKFSLGRINFTLMATILLDCQNFFKPFPSLTRAALILAAKKLILAHVAQFKNNVTKLHLSIDLQCPTLLLPQKKDVPSLLVLNTGNLTIENFFKEEEPSKQFHASANNSHCQVIDNILTELRTVSLSRAIMTLSGSLEIQEPILEPIFIHLDVKRRLDHQCCGTSTSQNSQSFGLCEIRGALDAIIINIGQRDLTSALSIWEDNISKIITIGKNSFYESDFPLEPQSSNPAMDDPTVKKLEAFFSQNEQPLCEISVKLSLDGLQLKLFLDMEEILSSPVRDLNHGLCKLTLGEVTATLDIYSDRSSSMKTAVRSFLLEDTRSDDTIVIRKIIQSHSRNVGAETTHVSISAPPILDISFTQTQTGDQCIDVLVEETRLNLSMSFLMHIGRYIMDSMPGEQIDKGVVNQGYVGDPNYTARRIPPDILETKSAGALKLEEQPGVSVSIRIRKPEVLLFGDLKACNANAVLFEAELMIESSRHSGSSSIVCSLSGVQAKSKSQAEYRKQPPHWVLRPCDIEISRKEQRSNYDVHVEATVSPVNVHLSASTVQTFTEIIQDAIFFFKSNEPEIHNVYQESSSHNDLWSQKKVASIPYKQRSQEFFNELLENQCMEEHCEVFQLKPLSIRILLEMEDTVERLPILMGQCELGATLKDWNYNFQMESWMKLRASCYNVSVAAWEPLIEPIMENDEIYKPWEATFKIYQAESHMMQTYVSDIPNRKEDNCRKDDSKKSKKSKKKIEKETESNLDESENNEGMVFLRPERTLSSEIQESDYSFEYNDESDSDNDENVMEKPTGTFGHLFLRDSNDEETSEIENSSGDEDEGVEIPPEHVDEPGYQTADYVINGNEIKTSNLATYMILHAQNMLNITITPNTVTTLHNIMATFLKSTSGIPIIATNAGKLNLLNNIGCMSRVELLMRETGESGEINRLIADAEFRMIDSPANSPSSPEAEASPVASFTGIAESFEAGFSDNSNIPCDQDSFPPLLHVSDESITQIYKTITEERLKINIEGFEDTLVYCAKRQGHKLLPLQPMRHEVRYHLAVHVETDEHFQRTITVSSPLQIRNETSFAIGLYYKKQLAQQLQVPIIGEALNPFDDHMRMAIVEPDDTLSVPLYITYHFPIYILPAHMEKYQISEGEIWWKELSNNLNVAKDVYCEGKDEKDTAVFGVKVVCEKRITAETNSRIPNYQIKILPPLTLDSRLPFAVDLKIPIINYQVRLEPGENVNVYSLKLSDRPKIIIGVPNYLSCSWTGSFVLTESENKFVKMNTENESEDSKPFVLCVKLDTTESWTITIHTQYWIVNKTGLPLYIRETCSSAIYEIQGEESVMFSHRKNRRKLVRLRAHQSGWSPAFSIDSVGTTGLIICRDNERRRKYQIQLRVAMSQLCPEITKIVTLLPNFLIVNKTRKNLRFMEVNEEADLWIDLSSGQSAPFWPHTDSMKMCVKFNNSLLVSQRFVITKIEKTVLRMDNGTALCVDVSGGSDSPFSITFHRYSNGDAPVRVENLCDDLYLKVYQANMGQVALLSPFQSLLYTWDDPTKERKLIWNVYNNKTEGYLAVFWKDGYGQETVSFRTLKQSTMTSSSVSFSEKITSSIKGISTNSIVEESSSDETDSEAEEPKLQNIKKIRKDKVVVYWVSFMEKRQRVLLFTQSEDIYLKARSIIDPEPCEKEIFLSLSGIGLSISAESSTRIKELAFASITDSPAMWELCVGKKWKTLNLELSAWMEDKHRNCTKKAQLDNLIDVDFAKMHMTKPFFGKLKRTYSPGIWLHCRKSLSDITFQGKIHKIQIDNQLHDAMFPVVLCPVSRCCVTSSVGSYKAIPCVQFVLLRQKKVMYDVYKTIKIIIQDFTLNLHKDFVVRLMDCLIPKQNEAKASISAQLRADLSNIHVPLTHIVDRISVLEQRNVIESLYISPVKINLKLFGGTGRTGSINSGRKSGFYNVVQFMFNYSHGVSFEKTAEFTLPRYEKSYTVTSNKQLLSDVSWSYSSRILQQFDVLILEQTVVGNPYGYNFQLDGDYCLKLVPEDEDEIADKIGHTVACLLGHETTEGTQSPTSSFVNTLLTHASQMKERQSDSKNSEMPVSILMANHSFSIGVELEISGVVVKPVNSMNQEELKYFFRGLGKGILSLIKRERVNLNPHTGLIADTIKRAQAIGYDFVSRINLPRYINPYSGVEPYSIHKAMGMHLLNTIGKGHYSDQDIYWAHAALSCEGKFIALVSLQRIFLIEKRCLWGSWNVEWVLNMNHLIKPPAVTGNKLILHVDTNDDPLHSPAVDWYIESDDQLTLEWLRQKIEAAMILNMEDSICPRNSTTR